MEKWDKKKYVGDWIQLYLLLRAAPQRARIILSNKDIISFINQYVSTLNCVNENKIKWTITTTIAWVLSSLKMLQLVLVW